MGSVARSLIFFKESRIVDDIFVYMKGALMLLESLQALAKGIGNQRIRHVEDDEGKSRDVPGSLLEFNPG